MNFYKIKTKIYSNLKYIVTFTYIDENKDDYNLFCHNERIKMTF